MTGTQLDSCGACGSVRAVRDLEHPWTLNAVCRDESACYAAFTNRSLATTGDAQPSLSVTATNDASTASPIATDTPSALREKTK